VTAVKTAVVLFALFAGVIVLLVLLASITIR
jgi:hypothetical protein